MQKHYSQQNLSVQQGLIITKAQWANVGQNILFNFVKN